MKWVPTGRKHLQQIGLQPAQVVSRFEVEAMASRDDPELPDRARTLLHDDVPLAVLGAWDVSPGIATAWAVLSPEALHHGVALVRGAHHWMRALVERDGLRRVQAILDPEHEAALVWIHKLGFVREGLMEQYASDGRAMWLYARTRWC